MLFSIRRALAQDVRRELGLADDEVAFATVARLFELKGHDDIVAVAAGVLAANPKVRFVWIGDGILRDRLIADLERRGIRGSFILTGLVPPDRIPELLGAVDAVIHPSLREGLARVLPQALLVGRPVISYDIDGAREVVLPETGILLKTARSGRAWSGDPRPWRPARKRGPRWDARDVPGSPTSSATRP